MQKIEIKKERISIDFAPFSVQLDIVSNFDELFDALAALPDEHPDVKDERIPYWADLWASALAMSEYLIDNQAFIKNKTVVEIGAGLALPSIVAAKLGARCVTITDYLPEAVAFAETNFLLNMPTEAAKFAVLDWRTPPPQYRADIVLASDVAYESRAFEPLEKAIPQLLNPAGRVIISEPNRFISKTFFQNLLSHSPQGSVFQNGVKTTKNVLQRGQNFTVNIFDFLNS